jgi:hypothetical protein
MKKNTWMLVKEFLNLRAIELFYCALNNGLIIFAFNGKLIMLFFKKNHFFLLQKPVVLTNRLKSISARMPDD